jgi:hypothetical protein
MASDAAPIMMPTGRKRNWSIQFSIARSSLISLSAPFPATYVSAPVVVRKLISVDT